MSKRAALYLEFSRPFTLVAPALGFLSGGLTAIGAAPREAWSSALLLYPLLGAVMAAVLNAASNALNQIYDLEIDRINKPARPLPTNRISLNDAWVFTWMISPSFVVPFLMIPIGAWAGVLTGNFWLLQALGAVMTVYGIYVCYLMLRRPEDLAVEENHISWAHMYRMMFVAQIGFALAYLL